MVKDLKHDFSLVNERNTQDHDISMLFIGPFFIWEIPISLASSLVLLEGKMQTFKAYYIFKFKGLITISPVSKMHSIKVVYNQQINVLTWCMF